MFKLFNTADERIGMTDNLNYIRKHENGSYVLCEEKDATGIAFNGAVYSLFVDNLLDDSPLVRIETTEAAIEIDNVNVSNGITFVTMAEAGSIDDVTMGEHIDLFAQWAGNVNYKSGNIRAYKDGKLYRCLSDHTSQSDWTPDVSVSLWTPIANPDEEWPAWSQPVGAHDAYSLGAKVLHNEQKWVSDVANNVWEPGVYGWSKYVETES